MFLKRFGPYLKATLEFARERDREGDPIERTVMIAVHSALLIARDQPHLAEEAMHDLERFLADMRGEPPEMVEHAIRESMDEIFDRT